MTTELQQILSTAVAAAGRGAGALLATVVRVRGSTYRRPGARMIVTDDGFSAGVVSGGCLERHVVEHGRRLTEGGRPVVVSFDTTSDDEVIWEFGLGCRGVVHLLLERIAPGGPVPLLDALRDGLAGACRVVIATVVAAPPSRAALIGRRLIHRLPEAHGDEPPRVDEIDNAIVQRMAEFAATVQRSTHACFELGDGVVEVFFEVVEPPVPFLVFGAGRDAEPLVKLAHAADWDVTLVDSRAAYATADRFSGADRIIVCGCDEVAEHVALDSRSFAVVMTHRYHEDLAILRALLCSSVAYIGLLGPRSRAEELLADLRVGGFTASPGQLARLYAPVGLDIAADNPEQIALAILAEMTAVAGGRRGGFLRDRAGPIHEPQSDNILLTGRVDSGRPHDASSARPS